MLSHFKQKTPVTCGSACFRILLSDIELISEKQAVDECLTEKSGTSTYDVLNALRNRGIDANLVYLNTSWEDYIKWLNYNSNKRKLYLSCEFKDTPVKGGRGRPRLRHHAIVASNGMIYDPALTQPVPIEAYREWNKEMRIVNMIIVDME